MAPISASGPLPAWPALLVGAGATLLRRRAGALPATGLSGHFGIDRIDLAQVARYRTLFGTPGSHVPLTYFYLLAQRAQLALMLDQRFPHRLPGLLHTGNALRLHALPRADSAVELQVSVLPHSGSSGMPGVVFSVELQQSGRPLVSCRSEYRRPGKNPDKQPRPNQAETLPESHWQTGWIVDQSLIRRYARVSGDCNPIHLAAWLARACGFRRAIAHGMYAVGQAAAGIERRTGRPVTAITADFRRPIQLPARATFGFGPACAMQGDYRVLLPDEQRLALSGSWETGMGLSVQSDAESPP